MASETLMKVKEVASFLGMNEATVYAWAQDGRIPAIKLGRTWRFRRTDLEAWLDTHRHDLKQARDGEGPAEPGEAQDQG